MKKILLIGGAVCLVLAASVAAYIAPALSSRSIVEAESEILCHEYCDSVVKVIKEEGLAKE